MATTKLEQFMEVYREELAKAITEHPDEYLFPVATVPIVADRMQAAIVRGSYNKDGYAFKGTCKRLGIKYTYAGINEYVREEVPSART